MTHDHQLDVPVDGGALRVHRWGEGSPTVLALHGITGTGVVLRFLAERLSETSTVLAPDLRGRGGSRELAGPYGLDRHVEDLVAVLEQVGRGPAVVVGHSMGAAVATQLAIREPKWVARLVLIDGGPILPLPPGVTAEQAAQAMLGPSLQRLSMTFPSREAYREFWRAHPAFADDWGPHVEWFLDSDLIGAEPELRSCVSAAAVEGDGTDLVANDTLRRQFGQYTGPVTLLRAPRDLMNRPQPLLHDEVVAELRAAWPHLSEYTVPDVNHYTILLSDAGIDHIASAVLTPQGPAGDASAVQGTS